MREVGHTVDAINTRTSIRNRPFGDVDLFLLAAAFENEERYPSFLSFQQSLEWLSKAPIDVPLASVAPLSMQHLREIAGKRSLVRFMCSSAVQDNPSSLRFYDKSGDEAAVGALQEALPGEEWLPVRPGQYDTYTHLLVISAVHCALITKIEKRLNLREEQRDFLYDTLMEAHRMIETENGSVEDALESASTPGGITEKLAQDSALHRFTSKVAQDLLQP